MMSKVSIVIPTYNEKENLTSLVYKIDTILSNYQDYELIIVDDNSPDGTGKLAEELSIKYPIKVIHRRGKNGLASAVIEGLNCASGEILGVMDADLQHPPEKISELLKEINEADIVIGSRYVEGGKIEKWSAKRRLLSEGAVSLSHCIFPRIRYIHDTVSGFFFLKRKVIENVPLNPIGFKILLEILVKGNYDNVKEIPYIFIERVHGRSNLNLKELINYLSHLCRLAKNEYWK